ncbi:MAG: hypothetical protein HQL53_00830 [Magnetococcales bacterium]|nr:hypothetical protein [Magnetococcales bacterium]
MMHKISVFVVMLFLLSACTSMRGIPVTESQATPYKEGKATYSQIVKAFGAPTTNILYTNGTRTIVYAFSSHSMVPFRGGAEMRMIQTSFSFDQEGVLLNKSSYNTGTGPTPR